MALETLFSQCITEIMAFQAVRLLAGGRVLLYGCTGCLLPKAKAVNEGSNQDWAPLVNHRPGLPEEASFSKFNIHGDKIKANEIPKERRWLAPTPQLSGC